jgi:beta-glucosidase/6-phospho-beta-glucosidase/beta-galactosidase
MTPPPSRATATCSRQRSRLESSRGSAFITSHCPGGSLTSAGFVPDSNRGDFWTRHVEFIAETFGDLASGWQPVNETNYYALAAYRGGGWPPGRNDRGECAQVSRAMQLATAEAAVRLRQTGAPVASIFGLSAIEPLDDSARTTALADRLDALNWACLGQGRSAARSRP